MKYFSRRILLFVMLLQGLVVPSILVVLLPVCRAFSLDRRSSRSNVPSPPTSTQTSANPLVRLWGKKAKRGRLGSIITMEEEEEGATSTTTVRAQEQKQSNPQKKAASKGSSGSISPDLAKFMQQKSVAADETTSSIVENDAIDDDDDHDAAIMTQPKQRQPKKKGGSSGIQQPISAQPSGRPHIDPEERTALVSKIKTELQTLIDENTKSKSATLVADIMAQLRQLVPIREQSQLRGAVRPPPLSDYRLLWAGSEQALTHVGTGLFNVPLARLQEVFFCCCGTASNTNTIASLVSLRRNSSNKNKKNIVPVQWIEVIRILGPFPNVRNTLTGTLKVSSSSSSNTNQWQIAWDSLIDGTGKEIYADQVRQVDLSLFYCDEQIIVMTTTTTTTTKENNSFATAAATATTATLSEAQDILVFVREDDMEDKLARYRVA